MFFLTKRTCLLAFLGGVMLLSGCPSQPPKTETPAESPKPAKTEAQPAADKTAEKPAAPAAKAAPAPTAAPADVEAAIARIKAFGGIGNSYKLSPSGALVELNVDTTDLTLEDVQLFAKLSDLEKLSFNNCRNFNDEFTRELVPLQKQLKVLVIGNSTITDASADVIAGMSNLVELNLHHNANIGNAACRKFATMEKLERLNLVYTGTTEVGMLSIRKIPNLKSLDIRGCNTIGNTGMNSVAKIAGLKSFQHRSDAVNDTGLESLTACENIESLYLQEFSLTDQAGESLKKFKKLSSLILFRCGEFGSEGLLQLKGLPLSRLTLRGLDSLDDRGMGVFQDLPKLKRLYLVELGALTDAGFVNLPALKNLEVLEIEIIAIGDESLKSIAQLPNLKELKIGTTNITNAGIEELLKLPKLESLRLLDNPNIDSEAAKAVFASKKFKVLDIGQSRGEVQE